MAAILAPLIRLSAPDLAPLSDFIKMPLFSHGRCGNVTFCGMNKSLWPSDCKIRNQLEVQTLTGRSRADRAAEKATEASDWLKFDSLFKLSEESQRPSRDSANYLFFAPLFETMFVQSQYCLNFFPPIGQDT